MANKKKQENNVDVQFTITKKQDEALKYLSDKSIREVMWGSGAGCGKAQSLDCKISTQFGWKKMRDIKLGDVISHPSGGYTQVIAIHPQGTKQLYEIEFSDGAKTECCGDHLWQITKLRKSQEYKVWTTDKMYDYVKNGNYNLAIQLCEPVGSNKRHPLMIHPYIMGVILGDGGLTKYEINITSADQQIIDRINILLPTEYICRKITSAKYGYSVVQKKKQYGRKNGTGYCKKNKLVMALEKMNLIGKKSDKKFIPDLYKHLPLDLRYDLLQGLMDTDGTISKTGKMSFSSSSRQLIEDFRELIWSLGAHTGRITVKKPYYRHKDTKKKIYGLDHYTIGFSLNNQDKVFSLSRKKSRINKKTGINSQHRKITSIKPIGKKECQCITVSATDGLYITDDYIVTHNSWLACIWLLQCCYQYPGTRYLLGRSRLTDLKKSTVNTMFDICSKWGILPDVDFIYNEQNNSITFTQTKSQILLFDLQFMPSDPNYDRLGSTEFTAAVIEEVPTIDIKAKNIVVSRLRYKHEEYNLSAKLLMTTNPTKGHWAYRDFYKPWTQGTLKSSRKFVFATVRDNEFAPDGYIENLESLDEIERKRLLDGDWEYEETQGQLIPYKSIMDMFTTKEKPAGGDYYLSCDIANMGKDSSVMIVWNDMSIVDIVRTSKQTNPQILATILGLISKYNIPHKHVVYDADGGYGVGVGQYIKGSIPFHNNGKPIGQDINYQNIKTQAYFKLAEQIKTGRINIVNSSEKDRTFIIEELEVLRSDKLDLDQKLSIISKADVKEKIGRSPDYGDAMMFRMFYLLKHKGEGKYFARVNNTPSTRKIITGLTGFNK